MHNIFGWLKSLSAPTQHLAWFDEEIIVLSITTTTKHQYMCNLMAWEMHNLCFLVWRRICQCTTAKKYVYWVSPNIWEVILLATHSKYVPFCPLMFTSLNLSFWRELNYAFAKNNFSLAIYFEGNHQVIGFLYSILIFGTWVVEVPLYIESFV